MTDFSGYRAMARQGEKEDRYAPPYSELGMLFCGQREMEHRLEANRVYDEAWVASRKRRVKRERKDNIFFF